MTIKARKEKRVAIFKDGYKIGTTEHWAEYAWRIEALHTRHHGFAISEETAERSVRRISKTLAEDNPVEHWEIAPLVSMKEATRVRMAPGKSLRVITAPSDIKNKLWARELKVGKRHRIVSETASTYSLLILGEEYKVNKKTLTMMGPKSWGEMPSFYIP